MTLNQRQKLVLEGLAVAAILVLAGVLRMGWPGITEFKADEARLLSLALDMGQEGDFAVRGISSSTGFPNFPMSVWLYALPTFIWPHAYAATLFTGLLNTMAVAGCYWMTRRYWGTSAALVATLLFAVSPWAIIFSRKIWAQNLLPLIVMVWAISAALAFVDGKRWYLTLHIFSLVVAIQTHLAAVALVPATLVFLVVFRRRVDWRPLVVGVMASVLVAAPFLVYLVQEIGQSTTLLPGSETEAVSGSSSQAIRYASMITVGNDIHSLAGTEQFENYLAQRPPMLPAYLLWGALVAIGIAFLIVSVGRNWQLPPTQVGFILLVWLAAPLVVFLWQWTPVYLHYFIAILPAPYIIAGVGFREIVSRTGRWVRGAAWAAVLASVALQVYAWLTLLGLLGSVATPGAFGTPLAVKLAAADVARQQLATGSSEVLIAGVGADPQEDSFAAEFDALLFDVPRRFVDISAEALFPSAESVVVIDDRTEVTPLATTDLYLAASAETTAIPARAGEGQLQIVSLPGGSAPLPQQSLEPAVLLSNFVTLSGTDNPTAVNDLTRLWQIHWRTADSPVPAAFHIFNHLVDRDGQRLAQVDAEAFSAAQWRSGDEVVSRFAVPWPLMGDAIPTAIRVGMYVFPDLTPVPLLDEAANPYADWLEIPLAE